MALDAQACAVRSCRRSVDRLDVCTERIALVLGPDSVLAIARYVGKPPAAWTGDHAANFYRTSYGTNRTRAEDWPHTCACLRSAEEPAAADSLGYHFERRRFLLV
jgi:hypothetical protein